LAYCLVRTLLKLLSKVHCNCLSRHLEHGSGARVRASQPTLACRQAVHDFGFPTISLTPVPSDCSPPDVEYQVKEKPCTGLRPQSLQADGLCWIRESLQVGGFCLRSPLLSLIAVRVGGASEG
jgi:hypothetical protein